MNRCRGLRHHELGDGTKPKAGPDCRQKRKTFHKQKQFVDSTHSRDGGSSSCASTATPSPSFDLGTYTDSSVDKANSSHHHQPVKRSNSLKNWVTNLFSTSFQKEEHKVLPKLRGKQGCAMKLKDTEYKELISRIMKEDFEMFQKQRPLLEHSLSTPDTDLFAVREFPQSSQPELRKIQSLDSEPHTNEALPCSKWTKKNEDQNGYEKNANDPKLGSTSQVSEIRIHHTENASNGAINLLNNTEVLGYNGNAKCCALDGLATTDSLLKETTEGLVRCQTNGHTPSVTAPANGSQSYNDIDIQDGNRFAQDISNRTSGKDTHTALGCKESHQKSNLNELEKSPETNGILEGKSNGYITNGTSCPNSNMNGKNGSVSSSSENLLRSSKDAHCVLLPGDEGNDGAAQSDSSPESPFCDSELNGQEGSQEGSSLSSPEDDATQVSNIVLTIARLKNPTIRNKVIIVILY